MPTEYYLIMDEAGIVNSVATSNLVPENGMSVDRGTYEAAGKSLGSIKWQDGELVPITIPPSIPDRVSRRRFRLQLEAAKLLEKVETWIASQDRATQIAYEDSDSFNRNEPKLQEAFAAVGYSPADVDAFFVKANQR